MQYLLSVYQPDGEPPADLDLEAVMRDVENLQKEMQAAGVWVFAGGLHAPSTATVLKPENGKVLTTDGPYVEGKEHLGGLRSSTCRTSTRRSNGAASTLWRPRCRTRSAPSPADGCRARLP